MSELSIKLQSRAVPKDRQVRPTSPPREDMPLDESLRRSPRTKKAVPSKAGSKAEKPASKRNSRSRVRRVRERTPTPSPSPPPEKKKTVKVNKKQRSREKTPPSEEIEDSDSTPCSSPTSESVRQVIKINNYCTELFSQLKTCTVD